MKQLLFIIVVFISINTIKAQAVIRIDSSFISNVPDTLEMNLDTLYLELTIFNDGDQTYDDQLSVVYQNLDSTLQLPFDTLDLGNQTIAPGESINVTFSKPIEPMSSRLGDDIVVIWPTKPWDAWNGDQIEFGFYVKDPTGIENHKSYRAKLYPNPFDNHIILGEIFNIKEVRIYNSNGQLVYKGIDRTILTDRFNSGFYIVEIELGNKQVIHKKMIKK